MRNRSVWQCATMKAMPNSPTISAGVRTDSNNDRYVYSSYDETVYHEVYAGYLTGAVSQPGVYEHPRQDGIAVTDPLATRYHKSLPPSYVASCGVAISSSKGAYTSSLLLVTPRYCAAWR